MEAERQAFERWAKTMDLDIKRVCDLPSSTYDKFETYIAWAAWSARAGVPLWMPIETAPEDGRVVLFSDRNGNRWTDCSPGHIVNGCGYPPTHWMPLPPPPQGV